MTITIDDAIDQRFETLPPLSDRELDVVRLVQYGLTDAEIGQKLGGITADTVKTHLRRINQRWGTNGRVQLLVTAYQHGFLPLPTTPVRTDGVTYERLWRFVTDTRSALGLPQLRHAAAETVLGSTLSAVQQLVRTNTRLGGGCS